MGGGLEGIRDMEDSVHGSLFFGGGRGRNIRRRVKETSVEEEEREEKGM